MAEGSRKILQDRNLCPATTHIQSDKRRSLNQLGGIGNIESYYVLAYLRQKFHHDTLLQKNCLHWQFYVSYI
jgi:hypothetical protein